MPRHCRALPTRDRFEHQVGCSAATDIAQHMIAHGDISVLARVLVYSNSDAKQSWQLRMDPRKCLQLPQMMPVTRAEKMPSRPVACELGASFAWWSGLHQVKYRDSRQLRVCVCRICNRTGQVRRPHEAPQARLAQGRGSRGARGKHVELAPVEVLQHAAVGLKSARRAARSLRMTAAQHVLTHMISTSWWLQRGPWNSGVWTCFSGLEKG